jgi:hypothetical protein
MKKSRFSFRKEQRINVHIRNAEALRYPVASGGSRALTSGTWCCLQRDEGSSQTCCRKLNGRLTCCSRLARRLFVCCNSRAFPSHHPLPNRNARLVCASAESASFRDITQSLRRAAKKQAMLFLAFVYVRFMERHIGRRGQQSSARFGS